jgi:hypothetical protein
MEWEQTLKLCLLACQKVPSKSLLYEYSRFSSRPFENNLNSREILDGGPRVVVDGRWWMVDKNKPRRDKIILFV